MRGGTLWCADLDHWRRTTAWWYVTVMRENAGQSERGAADEGELLIGTAAIAAFLRINQRCVSQLIKCAGLPVATVGLWKVTTKQMLFRWIEQRATNEVAGA